MNERFCTHAIESLLRGNEFQDKFDAFCRTVCPRFRSFRSCRATNDGSGYDVLMSTAHKEFVDFFDLTLEKYLSDMGIDEDVFCGVTARNLASGDTSSGRLFAQFQSFEDFELFGEMMQDKFDELFGAATAEGGDVLTNTAPNSFSSGSGSRRVRVLWDIENIPVSREHGGGLNTVALLNEFLRTAGLLGPGVDTLITAFCNAKLIAGVDMDQLDKSCVELVRASLKREDSDRKLSLRFQRDMDTLPPASTTFVVISGDQDYRTDYQRAVGCGFTVIVIHNAKKDSKQAQTLAMYASRVFQWAEDVLQSGVLVDSTTSSSTVAETKSESKSSGGEGKSGSEPRDLPLVDYTPILGWQLGVLFSWHATYGFIDVVDEETGELVYKHLAKKQRDKMRVMVHRSAVEGDLPALQRGQRMKVLVERGETGRGPRAVRALVIDP